MQRCCTRHPHGPCRNLLACPCRRTKSYTALATTYFNAGLKTRTLHGHPSCLGGQAQSGRDGGCKGGSCTVCTSWRQVVQDGKGEWREKEQRGGEAKGCEKRQEVLNSSSAPATPMLSAPSADPPHAAEPQDVGHCALLSPATLSTKPARHSV